MASQIVYKPVDVYTCRPGWTSREITEDSKFGPPVGSRIAVPPAGWDYPAGTVVECSCGNTHVSLGSPVGAPGIVLWRKEGKWERRRRERKAGRG